MPRSCRCLMIGYNPIELDGLACLLEPQFEVLAVAGEMCVALDAAMSFRPNAAVIRLEPEDCGLEMARNLREACPELAVIYLASDSDTYMSITQVSRTRLVPDALQTMLRRGNGAAQPSTELASRLSTREREVLSRLVRGLSMKEVARELNIAPRTVAFHKYRAMETNGLRSNAALLDFAQRNGLMPPLQRSPGPTKR
jgi:DNA-binding NarL/FixJ family response regulator